MTGQQRSSGVVLDLPANLVVEELPSESPTGHEPSGRARRTIDLDATIDLEAEAGAAAESEGDPIVQAMQHQDLGMVDQFVLTAASTTASTTASTRSSDREAPPSTLEIVVDEHEDAVVLLEQNGIYEWRYPTTYGKPKAAKQVRGQTLVEPRHLPTNRNRLARQPQ